MSFAAVVHAQAEGRRATVQLGRGLLELRDVLGPQTEIVVNGNRLFAGGTHVPLPPRAVLDIFQKHCQDHGWTLTEMEAALVAKAGQSRVAHSKALSLTLARQDGGNEGVVVCLVAPRESSGLPQLLSRARSAVETGDLSRLGDLRYAFARANQAGGSDVVTVWTEGDLNIKAFAETQTDAAGSEIPGLARPPGARRTLDVTFADGQYGLKSYRVPLPVHAALEAYARALRENDWSEVEGASASANEVTRTFVKDGAALLLAARSHEGATDVDILQVGSRGYSDVAGGRAPSQPRSFEGQ